MYNEKVKKVLQREEKKRGHALDQGTTPLSDES